MPLKLMGEKRGPTRSGRWLAALAWPCAALAQPADDGDRVRSLRPVEVLGQTPLPGFGQPVRRYPGHAQLADDADLERAKAANLPDFMARQLTGVTVNEVQGSPFQVDVNYRGHRLSPLLGTAQGLSLYLDGVRINEPFGDVVNWALLPEAAIASLALVPGSNPLYGLNTLGGALVLTTKSGLTHPGTEADFSIGRFGRRRVDLSHGAQWQDGWHGYVSATQFQEDGWREQSPGRLGNLFLKVGRQAGGTDWNLSYLHARSRLTGNGLLNQSLADTDRRAGYTFADVTHDRSQLLSLSLTRQLNATDQLAAVAWHRRGRREGSNGDISEDWAEWLENCEDAPDQPACADPADPGYVRDTAVLNRTAARQSETGATLQWTRQAGAHRFAFGAEAGRSRIGYDQYEQAARFDARRVAQPVAGEPLEHEVSLRGKRTHFSLFATDLITLGAATELTVSARWNRARVANALGHPSPPTTESFSYGKLNPAIGLTHALGDRWRLFAQWSQGTRVPTALELGCADPAKPCTLPTGLQADPYLKQVVARTVEIGARATPAPGVQLSGALFRTDSRDDIVFMRSGISQGGYFDNVPRTLRQGLELAARWRRAGWLWRADYVFLDATYRSHGELPGPLSTDETPNRFRPGTPIAGLPRHVLKLGVDWRAGPRLTLGADWLLSGSQAMAGNEGGDRPELGRVAGYSVLNARAGWQLSPRWQAYVRVNNLLDKRYASFGAGNFDLFPGGRALRAGEEAAAARFLAPGAPRSLAIGARYEWGP